MIHAKAETAAARSVAERRALGPAAIAAYLYTAVTLVLTIVSYRACDGHFVYPIDDTYIGMAMAKNIAMHGVWGVSRYGFSSSSSSLLFPILVAGTYRLFGVNQAAPFVLSWLFGLASILVAQRVTARYLEGKWQTLVLILLVAFTPLYVVGMLGMEHSLHFLLTLLFLDYFLREPGAEQPWRLGAITALMVAARYEGLFFVAGAFCLLVGQRRWREAATMGVAAAVPVCAYAIFSLAHGGTWLPNSVALKGVETHAGSAAGLMRDAVARLVINQREGLHFVLLLAAEAAVLAATLRRPLEPASYRAVAALAMVFAAGCMHLCTARVGWLFRYEDYLIGAGVVLLACVFPALREKANKPAFLLAWCLMLGAGIMLLLRSLVPAALLPKYARNIYSQQWQMAHLVQRYLPNTTIAANDIGAIEYFSDARCMDLVGLADADIFRARRAGRYTTEFLKEETQTRHVRVAMVYDSWFTPGSGDAVGPSIPPNWVRVARWSIPEALQLSDKTISFYAVDANYAGELREALDRYAARLPRRVMFSQP